MKDISSLEEYLLDIPKFKKKTLLSDTKKFYEALGAPGESIPVIHVAGTNGKGSTCFYISKILRAHGLSVGLFTSPHLVSIKERFEIDGIKINDEEFEEAFLEVKHRCDLYSPDEKETMHPSFFEYLFLMFMVWAGKRQPDVLVLETGLGGELDATNIFDKPSLSVICSIGMDHMAQLGDTIESIATQKAGIIKENVPLVFLDNKSVNNIFLDRAKEKHAKAYQLCEQNISEVSVKKDSVDFLLNFDYDESVFASDLRISLDTVATYQRLNASLSIVASKVFLKDAFNETLAIDALSHGHFRGRMDEIYPNVFTDGAHNENAIGRLLESLKCLNERCVLIFGACEDKDFSLMIEKLIASDLFDAIIFTKFNSPRACKVETLSEIAKKVEGNTTILIADDIESAYKKSESYNEKVLFAGSLYLVGEAIEYFDKKKLMGGK